MTMPHERAYEVPFEIYPFEDHWVEIDDLTLHFIDQGTGPVILFFHGKPGLVPFLPQSHSRAEPDTIVREMNHFLSE